jgi:hypothetical protein
MDLDELKIITTEIIGSESLQENINSVKKLSRFYNHIIAEDKECYLSPHNEKYVKGGQALSSYDASVCTDDYLRTCFFLKGIYKAIIKLQSSFPSRKINILYAGCGPFATLLLPLLPLLDKCSIEAIVLDINSTSIQSVEKIIETLQLKEFNLTLIETDATSYQKPSEWGIDLFISETMHYGLSSEPQVAITKNFIPQLLPHTIFIPNQIHIDLVYTFFGKEPFIKFGQNHAETAKMEKQPQRRHVKRLFSIGRDASFILSTSEIVTDFFPVPKDTSTYPDLCVFTEVEIYEGIALKTAESVLTNPYCITSLHYLKAHEEFQLVYNYGETPKWAYSLK